MLEDGRLLGLFAKKILLWVQPHAGPIVCSLWENHSFHSLSVESEVSLKWTDYNHPVLVDILLVSHQSWVPAKSVVVLNVHWSIELNMLIHMNSHRKAVHFHVTFTSLTTGVVRDAELTWECAPHIEFGNFCVQCSSQIPRFCLKGEIEDETWKILTPTHLCSNMPFVQNADLTQGFP